MKDIPKIGCMTAGDVKEAAYLQVVHLLDELERDASPIPWFIMQNPVNRIPLAVPPEDLCSVFDEMKKVIRNRIKNDSLCLVWDRLKQENKALRLRIRELEEDLGYRRKVASRLAGEDLWKSEKDDG